MRRDERRISAEEFAQCRKLTRLKARVTEAARWRVDGSADWITGTDGQGRFRIPLAKYPGRDRVICVFVHAVALPKSGRPTRVTVENQTPGVGYGEIPLGWEGAGFVPESDVPAELVRECPDPEQLGTAIERLAKSGTL